MARESTITHDQVAAAADQIKAAGNKPTARAVRDVLGTGSMATVLKFLQQWQGGQVRQSQAIDDTLDPAIGRAISNVIVGKVQEATADATARLADLQAEAEAIIAENERQAAELEGQAAELAALQEQHAALAGRAQQLESDATRTVADLVAERQAAEAARVELAKAELRLEAVPRIEAEIEKFRADLLQSRAQAAELHEAAAVATAKMEAAEAARKKAEQQLEAAAAKDAATAQALQNERVAVQACHARLESAAREISAATEAASKARAESKKSSEEAAELRGQLAAANMDKPAAPAPAKKPAKQAKSAD